MRSTSNWYQLILCTGAAMASTLALAHVARAHGDAPALEERQQDDDPAALYDPAEDGVVDSTPEPPAEVGSCWSGLATIGLPEQFLDFPGAVQRAIWANDDRLLEFLHERLTELINEDLSRATSVLGWISTHDDRSSIAIFAQALSESEAVHTPEIREKLLRMAENHAKPEHQLAALAILETQKSFDDATLSRLEEIAVASVVPEAQDLALMTIGQVMGGTLFREEGGGCNLQDCSHLQQSLLDIGNASQSLDQQRLAVEMLTDPAQAMSSEITVQIGDLLQTGSTRWTRQMASQALSFSGNQELALATFRRAFFAEVDFCTRVAIFRDSAVAAGKRALPLMAEFAVAEPELADDYEFFADVYNKGIVDFDQVILELFDKIHPECIEAMDQPLP